MKILTPSFFRTWYGLLVLLLLATGFVIWLMSGIAYTPPTQPPTLSPTPTETPTVTATPTSTPGNS